MTRNRILAALLVLAAGCSEEAPAGQVIARVNGVDITRRELLTEMRALNLPANTEVAAVQDELIARLIDRKLMAGKARDALIDRSPDYQALRRRSEEILLADQLGDRLGTMAAAPSASAVTAFIAANPQMFARRQMVAIDQMTFPRAALARLPQLESLPDIDAMAGLLDRWDVAYQRGQVTLDTRSLDTEAAGQLDAQAQGAPVLRVNGELATVRAVSARRTVWTGPHEQRAAATDALRFRARQAAFATAVAELRKTAKITYQPGFAPQP